MSIPDPRTSRRRVLDADVVLGCRVSGRVAARQALVAGCADAGRAQGEQRIADWLRTHDIDYRYDDKFQIIQGFAIRPDFYLPRYDVYVEYWGLDTTDYKIGMLLKQKLYQQEGKRLVSLFPADLPQLDARLSAGLEQERTQADRETTR
jgi:hypothetical protein